MSREFSIDMIPGGTQTAVACNQYESGDTWDFALYYNGGRYTIPEDAEVSITGTKADGAAYQVDGTVVNNAVQIEVTEQMTAAAGKTVAEILVVSDTDGTTLYSANFPIIVEPAAVQGDLSPSEIPTAIVGPDGTIYYSEEAIISEGVTSEVRAALYTLLSSAAYAQTGLTDEIAVIQSWAQQITAISVSPSTASITGTGTSQLSATTTPAGGTVTWSSSDTSVATVSSTGLVTGVGNGTATITASAGGKSATCAVTVTGNATLESISAVYTQSGTVYDTDSLDDLKDDLVVTGTYDDTSTATIADYTLSGTLTAGTSTVTVSYGGKTDTFTVTVTQYVPGLLYSWDFTNNNLTDSVESMVAQTTATQVAGGIKFEAADKYLVLNPSTTMSLKGKRVEIDIASMSDGGAYHSRLFSVSTNAAFKTNADSDNYMWKSSNDGWYVYASGSWSSEYLAKADYPGSYFSGKTLVLTFDADGYPTVSVGGTDLLTYTKAMSRTGYLILGGSYSDQLYRLAPTISAVRIYEVTE